MNRCQIEKNRAPGVRRRSRLIPGQPVTVLSLRQTLTAIGNENNAHSTSQEERSGKPPYLWYSFDDERPSEYHAVGTKELSRDQKGFYENGRCKRPVERLGLRGSVKAMASYRVTGGAAQNCSILMTIYSEWVLE